MHQCSPLDTYILLPDITPEVSNAIDPTPKTLTADMMFGSPSDAEK